MIQTEEDDRFDTLADGDSLNERLISSRNEEPEEQKFEESASFIVELNKQRSFSIAGTGREFEIDELDKDEQTVMTKMKGKNTEQSSRKLSSQPSHQSSNAVRNQTSQ